MRIHSKETQASLTPQNALNILKEGNDRFVNNLRFNRNLLQQVNETREGQWPFATILSCMDSRTSAELIFDQGLGDIFSIRIAGNVLNDDILGSMEFATKVVGTKIVVVLGHTKCGAITGACNDVKMGHLTSVLEKVKPAIAAEKTIRENRNGSNPEFVSRVTELNVDHVMREIREKSSIIRALEEEGKIMLVGGVYDIDTGRVNFFSDRS
jgi:carbonic anhydrase